MSSGSEPGIVHYAAHRGDVETLRNLLNSSRDPCERHYGSTALHHAAAAGQEPSAEVLLAKGADVDAADAAGATALHFASNLGHAPLLTLLLSYGASLSPTTTCDRRTPLHLASGEGRADAVSFLLSHGADPEPQSSCGTPLHDAARNGHILCVQHLLEAGVAVDPRDVSGKAVGGATPLGLAAAAGHIEVVKVLCVYGADLALRCKKRGMGAALHAARGGHVDCLALLLRWGASIDESSDGGLTLVMCAARGGHLSTLLFLAERGADIHAKNVSRTLHVASGRTAVHMSAESGALSCLRALHTLGADVTTPTNAFGETALSLAERYHHPQTHRFLLELGA